MAQETGFFHFFLLLTFDLFAFSFRLFFFFFLLNHLKVADIMTFNPVFFSMYLLKNILLHSHNMIITCKKITYSNFSDYPRKPLTKKWFF